MLCLPLFVAWYACTYHSLYVRTKIVLIYMGALKGGGGGGGGGRGEQRSTIAHRLFFHSPQSNDRLASCGFWSDLTGYKFGRNLKRYQGGFSQQWEGVSDRRFAYFFHLLLLLLLDRSMVRKKSIALLANFFTGVGISMSENLRRSRGREIGPSWKSYQAYFRGTVFLFWVCLDSFFLSKRARLIFSPPNLVHT